ncbi:hypothetical protein [Chryseobacterium limigenitum]|uniref:HEAT repeat-containing protein n=1 Tax=Chryseobacterium limigenitum TaxID=1612149 RepID=A0A1K2IMK2_9FLAO|nr:hypothetical protein [Chryseobacterium limigenitum]SFZ93482.1 hypothetical protein SAMN05216324_10596 [Chryseobacterium limigenitum]
MFKKILLTLFLISSVFSFSQTDTSNNQQNKKIELLNKKVDSLISEQNGVKTKILEERINQATETITNQSSMISSFGTLYTVITIILAFIGVVLPILTYQFGIKPSRDALKEFEEKSEAKFNNFLKERRVKEIDNAIENLKSEDNHIRNNSLNFLTYNSHQGLNEDQVLKIINIINNNNDENFLVQLLGCIVNEKNENLKKYFIEYLNTSQEANSTMYYCLKFFSYYNYSEYKNELKIFISNNNTSTALSIIFSFFPKNNIIDLLNDHNIIDILSSDALTFVHGYNFGKSNISQWNMSEEDYEKTYLYERLKEKFTPVN